MGPSTDSGPPRPPGVCPGPHWLEEGGQGQLSAPVKETVPFTEGGPQEGQVWSAPSQATHGLAQLQLGGQIRAKTQAEVTREGPGG